jgi:hypothetical protein
MAEQTPSAQSAVEVGFLLEPQPAASSDAMSTSATKAERFTGRT